MLVYFVFVVAPDGLQGRPKLCLSITPFRFSVLLFLARH